MIYILHTTGTGVVHISGSLDTAPGAPLPMQAIMEDISMDYIDKTVTMENWPHMEGQSISMASVHPYNFEGKGLG